MRAARTAPGATAYGYDGVPIPIGARVMLHPATDLWMRGLRYATVRRIMQQRFGRAYALIEFDDETLRKIALRHIRFVDPPAAVDADIVIT